MKHTMPTLNKGLRKEIHKRYDTVSIRERNTSKKCCKCHNDLMNYQSKHRLLVCSGCARLPVKHIVFKQRDANAATNMMNIARCLIDGKVLPSCFQLSSSATSVGF